MYDDKWNEFLKTGSVEDYLAYSAEQKLFKEVESKIENSNSGTDYKGNQYR